MIDGRNFLDEPIKNNIKTYENIKISTSHWDDYITGCLFSFLYFQAIKTNFTGNLHGAGAGLPIREKER